MEKGWLGIVFCISVESCEKCFELPLIVWIKYIGKMWHSPTPILQALSTQFSQGKAEGSLQEIRAVTDRLIILVFGVCMCVHMFLAIWELVWFCVSLSWPWQIHSGATATFKTQSFRRSWWLQDSEVNTMSTVELSTERWLNQFVL